MLRRGPWDDEEPNEFTKFLESLPMEESTRLIFTLSEWQRKELDTKTAKQLCRRRDRENAERLKAASLRRTILADFPALDGEFVTELATGIVIALTLDAEKALAEKEHRRARRNFYLDAKGIRRRK